MYILKNTSVNHTDGKVEYIIFDPVEATQEKKRLTPQQAKETNYKPISPIKAYQKRFFDFKDITQ